MLLPFVGAISLAVKIVTLCAKRGGGTRLLGVIASVILGGFCIGLGYWGAFDGYTEREGLEVYKVTYPVWGWIGIVLGGIVIILGSFGALTRTKQEIELEEKNKKLDKERKEEDKKFVKEMAKDMLAEDKIDDLDLQDYDIMIQMLEKEPFDSEVSDLLSRLKDKRGIWIKSHKQKKPPIS